MQIRGGWAVVRCCVGLPLQPFEVRVSGLTRINPAAAWPFPPERTVTTASTTEGTNGSGKGRSARGRKDAEKQEAVIKTKVVKDKIDELVRLKKSAEEAAACFNDAVKAAAEKSGLLASVVRSFVTARAGEDFEGAHRKIEQLALVFEEVGE